MTAKWAPNPAPDVNRASEGGGGGGGERPGGDEVKKVWKKIEKRDPMS